jgi:hypothetical protein
MGRARQNLAVVASDNFTAVMGTRRGHFGDNSFAAATPSRSTRFEADLLRAGIEYGEIAPVLQLLRAHKKTSPLLEELREGVVTYLLDHAYRLWTPAAADFVDIVAGDGFADFVVVDDGNRILHLWARGHAHAYPEHAPVFEFTICGRVVNSCERAVRGTWRDSTFYEQCPVCNISAAAFPETTETRDGSVFPAHQEDAFRELLLTRVSAALDAHVRSRQHLTNASARAHAVAAFGAPLRAHALTRLKEGKEPLLERVLRSTSDETVSAQQQLARELAAKLHSLQLPAWSAITAARTPRRPHVAGVRPLSIVSTRTMQKREFTRDLKSTLRAL